MVKVKLFKEILHSNKYKPLSEEEKIPLIEDRKPDTLFLIFTMFTATMIMFTGGSVFAWTSPVIPKFQSKDSSVNPLGKPITTVQISLLSGLPPLISFFGCFAGPYTSGVIGRKRTLQIIGLVMVGCDVVTALSNDINIIIISKCISITFYAAVLGVVTMYTIEVCEDHNRGKYGCLLCIFMPVGTLYTYVLGPIFSVKVFTLLTTVPVVVFLFLFCFAPESPMYLLSKGKRDECKEVIKKLRSNKNIAELDIDLEKIEETLQFAKSNKNFNIFNIFKVREARIGLLLAGIPAFLQFTAGAPILEGFIAPVFNHAHTGISGNTVAIMVGIIKVISYGIASFLVDRLGRRILLLFSSITSCLFIFLLGLYFYLEHVKSPILSSIYWLPVASIIIFMAAYSFGVGSVPTTLLGELFTQELRPAAVSFIYTGVGLVISFMFFAFPLVAEYFGLHWCMWYFSFNCFCGAILIYLMLPETKCKSILEIQSILQNYKFRIKKPA